MIKTGVYTLCIILLVSCSKSKTEEEIVDNIERPVLLEPKHQQICLKAEEIVFEWSKSNQAVTYEIELATDKKFTQTVDSQASIATNKIQLSLQKASTYYWRVKAIGKTSESEYSSVFQFYTQGDAVTNHLPQTPTLTSPQLNQVLSDGSLSLSWSCVDKDVNDILVYDVFLGTDSEELELVSENQSASKFTTSLEANTYYWRIIAKDNNGGMALSTIWSFNVQ
ncbi:fibronectin type III domain-containing protein [Ochrovirga pacifica]|uniref:hypothetical protein n=1 Tax=Ochrovirga pacifica TaxID=1042376 RepID=UPI000255955A|nr:hypothetical protein [Ochrovirga pacifica]